jgi:hypothetical protein
MRANITVALDDKFHLDAALRTSYLAEEEEVAC